MEIEKIVSQIKEGLKNSSLSDRTIRSKAERLAKKVTDENSVELIADAIEDLKELGGQLNKDVADKAKEIEEKLKTPVPTPTPTPAPKPDDVLGELMKRLGQMETNFQEKQKTERVIALKKEATNVLKEKHKASREYILENVMAKVEVADGDTADSLAEKAVPLYDSEYKRAYGDSSVPRSSEGGSDAGQKQAIDALFEKKLPKKN